MEQNRIDNTGGGRQDMRPQGRGDLAAALAAAYPDGLAVRLGGENILSLADYRLAADMADEHMLEPPVWMGLVDGGELPYYNGELDAELRLPPSAYGQLYASEELYSPVEPEADGHELDDRYAAALLREHGSDLRGAGVELPVREENLQYLYVEGRPFHDVVQAIEDTGVSTDTDLKILLGLQNLYERGLPADGRLPETLAQVMEPVRRQHGLDSLCGRDLTPLLPDLRRRAEHMLRSAGALPIEPFNLHVRVHGGSAADAYTLAGTVNNLYAAGRKAFAVASSDGSLEVSVSTHRLSEQSAVQDMLHMSPSVTDVERRPYRDMCAASRICMITGTAKLLTGHVGAPLPDAAAEYRLVTDGRMPRLLPAGSGQGEPVFVTQPPVRMLRTFTGQFLPLRHLMRGDDFSQMSVVTREELAVRDGVLHARAVIGGGSGPDKGQLADKQLLPSELRLYERLKADPAAGDHPELVDMLFIRSAFKPDIDCAWAEERTKVDGRRAELDDPRLNRVTHARLYGKVDDLHVGCFIDGQQMTGRPLTPDDARSLSFLRGTAETLGRDRLNYANFVHRSIVTSMAVRAFSDVLSRAVAEEQGRGRAR